MAHTDDSQIKAMDRELEARASGAMRELMEHRWYWTLDETNPGRKTVTEYGRLVGRAQSVITKSARGYEILNLDVEMRPQDAYALAGMGEDKQIATKAIAEVDDLTIGGTETHRRPQIKALTAEIADLPDEEKETIARELAHDPGFMAGALAEHAADVTRRQAASKAGETARPPLRSAIGFGELRLAVSKVEKAAAGIDGDLLDDSGRQSLREQSRRMRALADYLDALAEGNIDAELEELLS